MLMLIAQITDLHVTHPGWLCNDKVDTGKLLGAAVERIRGLVPAPDLVIVTGDLVDHGERDEYREVRQLMEPLSVPVFVVPGNHDSRSELVRAFAGHRYLPRTERFLHYTIEGWPVRLVALDTVVEGQMAGEMCAERLLWLDRALAAERNQPTLIFMHHPPFVTGLAGMDAIGLKGAAAMADILARHPQVQLVTAGHLHRAIQRRIAATLAATCPSTAHQVTLDLDGSAPISFTLEPPAFQLHLWDGAGLITHTVFVERFDGPHAFA
jgi:3',5'-cyclic AMP phosphodiesterase CpdA